MYREHRPSEPLRTHVECYWTLTAPSGDAGPQRVLPDGCMDIIFDLSGASGMVVGTMTRALVTTLDGRAELFGVRFRPGAAPLLIRQPASESTDASLDLRAVWGRSTDEIADRIASAPSLSSRIALVERELSRRLAAADAGNAVARHAIALLVASRGELRVDELSSKVGLGARQLERSFDALVGVGPKTFARIVRFRAVVDAILGAASSPRWADLAARFGFYDQAHLIREFHSLAGLAPTALLRERAMSHSSNTANGAAPILAGQPRGERCDREDRQGDAHLDRGED
jgi:AraC-like DNA-binding protein